MLQPVAAFNSCLDRIGQTMRPIVGRIDRPLGAVRQLRAATAVGYFLPWQQPWPPALSPVRGWGVLGKIRYMIGSRLRQTSHGTNGFRVNRGQPSPWLPTLWRWDGSCQSWPAAPQTPGKLGSWVSISKSLGCQKARKESHSQTGRLCHLTSSHFAEDSQALDTPSATANTWRDIWHCWINRNKSGVSVIGDRKQSTKMNSKNAEGWWRI